MWRTKKGIIKALRSDNESEYTSNVFEYFFKDARIKRELILSYNPRHKKVVERKNQSIIVVANAIMHEQDFFNFYGQKNTMEQYTCKIRVLIGFWRKRNQMRH